MSVTPPPLTEDIDLLVAAAHRGEVGIQRLLYERYYAFARTIALHYATDAAAAEDIVQDARFLPQLDVHYHLSERFSMGVEIAPGFGVGGRLKL